MRVMCVVDMSEFLHRVDSSAATNGSAARCCRSSRCCTCKTGIEPVESVWTKGKAIERLLAMAGVEALGRSLRYTTVHYAVAAETEARCD